ncbi:cleavage and polyadenylation specificity factor subunit 2 [Pelomyxa schiedti]|nr:cleavage and polyadenylation specificity factor subunit 2 [Pelomyxa schiedti]
MATRVQFRPLRGACTSTSTGDSGGGATTSGGGMCYLLTLDDYNILLDCGWDHGFKVEDLAELAKVASSIDAVLITHSDIEHIGALPYARAKLGLTAKVYSTIPVYSMSQMFLYDVYQSVVEREGTFAPFTLDDVDACFEPAIFKNLKYSQHLPLEGKGRGIEITPYAAGHMVGGAVWKISKESEDFVYAVDYNHRKEQHLNGTVLDILKRPAILITDAYNASNTQATRRKRDTELVVSITETLKNGGNVLLPIDTAGRSLELALCLEKHWAHNRFGHFGLALLNYKSFYTLEFAKSQIEWMSDSITKSFEANRDNPVNPFAFSYLKLTQSLSELSTLPRPMCVLASQPTLTSGFAQDLFIDWAPNPKNLIIFSDRSSPGTLARFLVESSPPPQEVTLNVSRMVDLEGEELSEYLSKNPPPPPPAPVKTESTATSETQGNPQVASPFSKSYDMTPTMFSQMGMKTSTFPFVEPALTFDEYGLVINPDEILPKSIPLKPERKPSPEPQPPPPPPNPKKRVTNTRRIPVNCRILYLDFEGRVDGKSIRSILTHVSPRRIIFVRGSHPSLGQLTNWCETYLKSVCKSVHSPAIGECVDITEDTTVYKISLKDSLLSEIDFSKVGDCEVGYVQGQIVPVAGTATLAPLYYDPLPNYSYDTAEQEEAPATDAPPDSHKLVETLPGRNTCPPEGHQMVFVGDVRLSEFCEVLSRTGVQVLIDHGILLCCGGKVSLQKVDVDGNSQVIINGNLCPEYFKIRDLLYTQYTKL